MILPIWNSRNGKTIAIKRPEVVFGQSLEEGADFKGRTQGKFPG